MLPKLGRKYCYVFLYGLFLFIKLLSFICDLYMTVYLNRFLVLYVHTLVCVCVTWQRVGVSIEETNVLKPLWLFVFVSSKMEIFMIGHINLV